MALILNLRINDFVVASTGAVIYVKGSSEKKSSIIICDGKDCESAWFSVKPEARLSLNGIEFNAVPELMKNTAVKEYSVSLYIDADRSINLQRIHDYYPIQKAMGIIRGMDESKKIINSLASVAKFI